MVQDHFTEVLGQASTLTRKYFKQIYLITILIVVIISLFNTISSYLMIINAMLAASFGEFIMGVWVALYIWCVITLYNLSQLTLVKLVSQHYTKDKQDLFGCFMFAFKKTTKVMGYQLIMLLVIIPILILLGIYFNIINSIPVIDIMDTASVDIQDMTTLVTIIYAYFLVPFLYKLGVLLTVTMIHIYIMFFSLGLPIIAAEEVGPIQVIKRSYGLIKYNFGGLFGNLVLVLLSIAGTVLGFESISGILIVLISLITEFIPLNVGVKVLFYLFTGGVAFFTQLLGYIFIMGAMSIINVCIYYNQRAKYEGYDLELRLKDMIKNK